ncbi:uncharacterized protein KGF55_005473 [Candida pseudojiufengensis]|uniref:uncharacterized protein n=1 Tax=Candida pseudojiufengensis TaxID=497109 RepID=UPI0022241946|nr:uncharacterized protein KGF55_005473 [Candida pseudojiufengensis]KAI5959130.1 hypothetical protein KGF55_005473 [Candida pseudojiufengensis]
MGNESYKQFTPWGKSAIDPSTSTIVTTKTSEYIVSKTPIGIGSYSKVYKCQNKTTNKNYACKKYKKLLIYGMENSLINEFQILKNLTNSDPKLINLIDYFETNDSFYLVTDLANGGDLFQKITENDSKKLDISTSKQIIIQLIDCLNFLHKNNIIHRDIKTENIFFKFKNSNSILLGDFGLSKVINPNTKLNEICGTISYMAPEMLTSLNQGYSKEIDIWSIGCVFYFMISGYLPFDCETEEETKDAIINKKYLFEPKEYWIEFDNDVKNFIELCFELNVEERTLNKLMDSSFLRFSKPYLNHKVSASSETNRPNISSIQKQQILNILSNKTSSTTKPSSKSSSNSINFHQGELCKSPDCVTELNTPLMSIDSSRNSSYFKVPQFIDEKFKS